MPKQRVLEDVLPGADAGYRRVDERESSHARWILCRKRVADHVADVVGDEGGASDLEVVEDAGDVMRLRLLVEAAGRLGGEAQVPADRERLPCSRGQGQRPWAPT